jgi:hypothetical protein
MRSMLAEVIHLGIVRLSTDCRRTFARNQRDAGVPREIIKKIAGWATDEMWNRYNIVDTEDIAAGLEQAEKVVSM